MHTAFFWKKPGQTWGFLKMQEGGSENKSQQGRVHKASEQLSSQKCFRFKNLKKLEVSCICGAGNSKV